MSQASRNETQYGRLKQTATIGLVAIFAWYGIVGGYVMIRSGNLFGWVMVVVGIGVFFLPFAPIFRINSNTLASNYAFPLLVFVPNILIILMVGYLASIYLGDPFLTYNELDTLTAVVFGGAALLAVAALVINLIAYLIDRRS